MEGTNINVTPGIPINAGGSEITLIVPGDPIATEQCHRIIISDSQHVVDHVEPCPGISLSGCLFDCSEITHDGSKGGPIPADFGKLEAIGQFFAADRNTWAMAKPKRSILYNGERRGRVKCFAFAHQDTQQQK